VQRAHTHSVEEHPLKHGDEDATGPVEGSQLDPEGPLGAAKLSKYDKSLIDGWELSLKGRRLSERTPKGSYLLAVELLARWTAGNKKPTLDSLERGDLDAWLVWRQERPRPAGESHC
jgi:hypothetical protein